MFYFLQLLLYYLLHNFFLDIRIHKYNISKEINYRSFLLYFRCGYVYKKVIINNNNTFI